MNTLQERRAAQFLSSTFGKVTFTCLCGWELRSRESRPVHCPKCRASLNPYEDTPERRVMRQESEDITPRSFRSSVVSDAGTRRIKPKRACP